MKKSTIFKWAGIVVVVLVLLWINQRYLQFTPTALREWILSFGWYSPFVFMFVFTLRALILFPASILSLAGGLAFGHFWGTIYTVIGSTAGAVISFYIARKLGQDLVRKEWKGRMHKLERQLEKHGFMYIFLLRLIPIVNFDLISYAAGASKIPFKAYFYGTLVGIIPGTFAYNYLGASIVEGGWQDILSAVIVFVIVLIVPLLFRRKIEQKYHVGRRNQVE